MEAPLSQTKQRGDNRCTLAGIGTTQSYLPYLRLDQNEGILPLFSTYDVWNDLSPLWSLFMMLKFLFKANILLISTISQKDRVQLKACLLQRQPSDEHTLEGDQKLHKWTSGPWTKFQSASWKAAVHVTTKTDHEEKQGPPGQGYQSWEQWSAFFSQTMLGVGDKAIQKTCAAFPLKSEQKHKNSPGLPI